MMTEHPERDSTPAEQAARATGGMRDDLGAYRHLSDAELRRAVARATAQLYVLMAVVVTLMLGMSLACFAWASYLRPRPLAVDRVPIVGSLSWDHPCYQASKSERDCMMH